MSEWVRLNQLVWIAIYAAIVATIVLIWNIFKWKVSGPKLAVECAPISDEPSSEFTRRFSAQIAVKVTNKGDQPTLITDIEYHVYHNWWATFRQRPYGRVAAGVVSPDALPWKLEPGEVWEGVGQQPPGFTGRTGVYCVVRVSGSKKGIQCRMAY